MIAICNVVFGPFYIELWRSMCLPTELSKENVAALNAAGRSIYVVYTSEESFKAILDIVESSRLRKFFFVEIHIVDVNTSSVWGTLSAAHKHCIENYKAKVLGIVFSSADVCYHDGYFTAVYDAAISKNKSCLGSGIRINASCIDLLKEQCLSNLTKENAVVFLFDYIHKIHADQHLSSGACRSRWPSTLFERSGNVLSMRGFHHHPIFVLSRHLSTQFSDTIDGQLVDHIYEIGGFTVLSGLNPPVIISVTADTRGHDLTSESPLTSEYISRWAAEYASEAHFSLFVKHVFVYAKGKFVLKNEKELSPQLTEVRDTIEELNKNRKRDKSYLGLTTCFLVKELESGSFAEVRLKLNKIKIQKELKVLLSEWVHAETITQEKKGKILSYLYHFYPQKVDKEWLSSYVKMPGVLGLRSDGWCGESTQLRLGYVTKGDKVHLVWGQIVGGAPIRVNITIEGEAPVSLMLQPSGRNEIEIPIRKSRLKLDISCSFTHSGKLSDNDPFVGSALLLSVMIVPQRITILQAIRQPRKVLNRLRRKLSRSQL